VSGSLGFVACDLGASSGRVELVRFDGDRVSIEEAHRFPNRSVRAHDTLYWDALRLWGDVRDGIRRCATLAGGNDLLSVGVDAWGVDFALLDRRGRLLGSPVSYRDRRTEGIVDSVLAEIPRRDVFAATGTQFLRANTLYQLVAMVREDPGSLDRADTLLMMPDLFHYWLSGVARTEFTVATTSQCLNAVTRQWAAPLLERLGVPARIFPVLAEPASVLGRIRPEVRSEGALPDLAVAVPASHDTASAVAAADVGPSSAFVSCGTWSLVGVEMTAPRIDDATMTANLTNEGGLAGTWRYLQNVAGLWLLEECRRSWARAGTPMDHAQLADVAAAAPALRSVIDVDDPDLFRPGDMPSAIRRQCARLSQPIPETPGQVARCVLDSLALRLGVTVRTVGELTGRVLTEIRLFGGGARNALLCQITADAIGLPVVAGPAEATALGNALGQMLAHGHIASLAEGRALVARSLPPRTYEPRRRDGWAEAEASVWPR
jgi:rhamnulokinase